MRLMPLSAALIAAMLAAPAGDAQATPYPTDAVADYLFACMATNGQTPDALKKCSCSIDVISSIVPFQQYEQAATVLSMRQVRGGGEKMDVFRETAWARSAVDRLKRAEVEAEVRCFG